MKIEESLKEVFLVKGKKRCKEITRKSLSARLNEVGLKEEHLDRYPAQLSGGQLQRVNIARVMALEPELIIADEPTSNLDVSVQAQIIHLMLNLKKKTNSTLVFISHDLDLVSLICNRVAVIKRGEIVAIGVTEKILNHKDKRCLSQ